MKIYRLDGKLYQEPMASDFNYDTAELVTSPINEDGSVILSHYLAKDLAKKGNGNFYFKYNQDLTPDFENEKLNLIIRLATEVRTHFSSLMDLGFQFKDYWITSKRSQQDDLLKLITAVEMMGAGGGHYRCYTYIDEEKSEEKSSVLFSIQDLKDIFKTGSLFILKSVGEEETMIKSLENLTLQELEDFTI